MNTSRRNTSLGCARAICRCAKAATLLRHIVLICCCAGILLSISVSGMQAEVMQIQRCYTAIGAANMWPEMAAG